MIIGKNLLRYHNAKWAKIKNEKISLASVGSLVLLGSVSSGLLIFLASHGALRVSGPVAILTEIRVLEIILVAEIIDVLTSK